jgi:hypothetical protein
VALLGRLLAYKTSDKRWKINMRVKSLEYGKRFHQKQALRKLSFVRLSSGRYVQRSSRAPCYTRVLRSLHSEHTRSFPHKTGHKGTGGPSPVKIQSRLRTAPQSQSNNDLSSLVLTCIRKTLDLELDSAFSYVELSARLRYITGSLPHRQDHSPLIRNSAKDSSVVM